MKSTIYGHNRSLIAFASKKLLLIVALFATLGVQKTFAQDNASPLFPLLTSYYSIKDALVAGNANAASAGATAFLKAGSAIDSKVIAPDQLAALQKDAGAIEQMKDIKHQREHFAGLSANMLAVVKSAKLVQPVYSLYCPMEKSYWLSSDKTVKNPYFGSAMLTCGKVSETINQ